MRKLRVIVSFKLKDKDIDTASIQMTQFVQAARKQSGCLSFDFVRSEDHPNHFFFLEIWGSEADNLQHIRSDYFRKFAPFFATHFEKLKVDRVYSFLNNKAD